LLQCESQCLNEEDHSPPPHLLNWQCPPSCCSWYVELNNSSGLVKLYDAVCVCAEAPPTCSARPTMVVVMANLPPAQGVEHLRARCRAKESSTHHTGCCVCVQTLSPRAALVQQWWWLRLTCHQHPHQHLTGCCMCVQTLSPHAALVQQWRA